MQKKPVRPASLASNMFKGNYIAGFNGKSSVTTTSLGKHFSASVIKLECLFDLGESLLSNLSDYKEVIRQ